MGQCRLGERSSSQAHSKLEPLVSSTSKLDSPPPCAVSSGFLVAQTAAGIYRELLLTNSFRNHPVHEVSRAPTAWADSHDLAADFRALIALRPMLWW